MPPKKKRIRRAFGIVEELPSGQWRARYTHQGTRYPAPGTFATEEDADIWLNNQRAAIRFGTWVDPAVAAIDDAVKATRDQARTQTLGTYAAEWIRTRTNSRGEALRVRTRTEYERLLRPASTRNADDPGGPLAELVGKPLGAIDAPTVRKWRATQLKKGTKTQTSAAYSLLNSILKTAVADHVIAENPCQVKGGTKTKTGVKVLPPTDEELVAILEAINPEYRALVALGATGLRYGEAVALLASDITVEREMDGSLRAVTVRVDKQIVFPPKSAGGSQTGEVKALASERDVLVFGEDASFIAARVAGKIGAAPLYPAIKDPGGWLHPTTFHRHWKKAREAAGRPDLRFHALRHYAGTRYAQSGATVRETMARLGHSTTEAAMRYQHAGNRDAELAARAALLAEHPEVDGVFAANDLTAAGVLQAARAAGRSVPRTLRLVGYDDTQLGLTTHPQLTTITNPGRDLARRATRMVLNQLAGQPAPPPIISTPVLVERASG